MGHVSPTSEAINLEQAFLLLHNEKASSPVTTIAETNVERSAPSGAAAAQ